LKDVMEKFKAIVRKTDNTYVTLLCIIETFYDKDDDGYCQIEGEKKEHVLEIEGNNSFQRAKLLAKQINKI